MRGPIEAGLKGYPDPQNADLPIQLTREAFPWVQSHPLLQSTAAILQAGAHIPPSDAIDERLWHEKAVALSALTPPSDLSTAAFTLLANVPYQETVAAIQHLQQRQNFQEAMSQIKIARKLFFIVRDLIILTSEGSAGKPPSEFIPLIGICRTLGEIADTNGISGKKRSIRSLHELQEAPPTPQSITLKTQAGLQADVTRRLHTASLLLQSPVTAPFKDVHTARKEFRRVAALGIMSVASSTFGDYRNFAIEGVALSHRHGKIKDSISL